MLLYLRFNLRISFWGYEHLIKCYWNAEIANKLLAEYGLFRPQIRGFLAPFMHSSSWFIVDVISVLVMTFANYVVRSQACLCACQGTEGEVVTWWSVSWVFLSLIVFYLIRKEGHYLHWCGLKFFVWTYRLQADGATLDQDAVLWLF